MKTRKYYLFEPTSQNTLPNIKALIVVKYSLIALYAGLLQYTRFCFHKHRKNWDNEFCENIVSNFSGSDPAGGCSNSKIEDSTPLIKTLTKQFSNLSEKQYFHSTTCSLRAVSSWIISFFFNF